MCLPHHQLILRWNGTAHGPINGIRAKVLGSSHRIVIAREGLLGGPQFDSPQKRAIDTSAKLIPHSENVEQNWFSIKRNYCKSSIILHQKKCLKKSDWYFYKVDTTWWKKVEQNWFSVKRNYCKSSIILHRKKKKKKENNCVSYLDPCKLKLFNLIY